MKPINVGLLGLGHVGSGVVTLLKQNLADITRRMGRQAQIRQACVRDLQKSRTCDTQGIALTADPQAVIQNPEIDVLIEVMGGTGLAKECVLAALDQKKSVITANKALIAEHGNEIFEKAKKQGVAVLFEAAVTGGLPIIKLLREGLAGNPIQGFAGIINGTANYILSRMADDRLNFEVALKEAQKLGYAEVDPRLDVEGIDAAHKLTILSSLAFGIPLQFQKVYVEGIQGIDAYDVETAKTLGCVIKHLAIATRVEKAQGCILHVHPVLLKKKHPLAQVHGAMNAIYLMTEAGGPMLFSGAGAGGLPTASAIIADVIDWARSLHVPVQDRLPMLGFQPEVLSNLPVQSMDSFKTSYYLRIHVADQLGTLAKITQILAEAEISIDTLLQKHEETSQGVVPIVIITHPTREQHMNQAIAAINALPVVKKPVQRIRIFSSMD